mmetsp:Transcript_5219/g.10636  ORF Transcript_5219/g.10636 Transcript_5219/m.10636 type:complete len:368 (-) Transcript_5219:200-1303(-)
MLRGVQVGELGGGLLAVHLHHEAVRERLRGDVAAGQRRPLRLNLRGDALEVDTWQRHQDHLAVLAVLRLRQEVGGDEGVGGVLVGDDEHLRGPRGHVDAHHRLAVLQRHLRRRHKLVPRPEDLRHLGAGVGAVGHGGHGLCAARLENVGDARLLGHVEHLRADGAVLHGGGGHYQRAAPGDLRRHRQHQRRRRQHRRPARHVQPHRRDRPSNAAADNSRHGLNLQRLCLLLSHVERVNVVVRHVERSLHLRVQSGLRNVLNGNHNAIKINAIELGGVFLNCSVPLSPHVLADGAHDSHDRAEVDAGALADRRTLLLRELRIFICLHGRSCGRHTHSLVRSCPGLLTAGRADTLCSNCARKAARRRQV